MTLAEKDTSKKEISLGCGCEERERRRAKRERERQGGRSVVCVMGWLQLLFFVFCCNARRITNFVFGLLSSFAGRPACAQDRAFPQLLWHAVNSFTAGARFNKRQRRSNAQTNS
jgi:hypothetical protein